MANLMFAAPVVELLSSRGDDPPDLIETATSKHVTRKRCAECFSPVAASLGKKSVVVPFAMFERDALPAEWRSLQHHMYYDSRVIDVNDDLPKYKSHFGGELWVDEATADPGAGPE